MRDIFLKDLSHLNDMYVEMGRNAQEVIKMALVSLQKQDIQITNICERINYMITGELIEFN